MSASFTATIRVAPLVRKYLAKHYQVTPFRLRGRQNPFAAYLLNCLDSQPAPDEYRLGERLTDELTVVIGDDHAYDHHRSRQARHLPAYKVVGFNNMVHQIFMQTAVREMAVAVEYKETKVRAAERILRRYDLSEDELSLDTLVRYYTAYKDTIFGQVKAGW